MAASLKVSLGSLSRIERDEQWPDRAVIERIIRFTDGEVTANDFVDFEANSGARTVQAAE